MTASLATTPENPKVGDELSVQGSGLGAAASLTTALTGTNNDLVFTAKALGTGGNAVHIVYADPGGTTASLSVGVSGSVITVNLARAASAITTTAAQAQAAIVASTPANALVSVANAAGNDGTGVVTALSSTALSGGTDIAGELELIHSSDAQDDVRIDITTVAGAFDSSSALTYKLESDGSVTIKYRDASGAVVAETEVSVFTEA